MKVNIELCDKEIAFLIGILDTDKQTALQLLAAEHAYRPSLLPKFHAANKMMKAMKRIQDG